MAISVSLKCAPHADVDLPMSRRHLSVKCGSPCPMSTSLAFSPRGSFEPLECALHCTVERTAVFYSCSQPKSHPPLVKRPCAPTRLITYHLPRDALPSLFYTPSIFSGSRRGFSPPMFRGQFLPLETVSRILLINKNAHPNVN